MQFTEAVARSSRHQIPVNLPLQGILEPEPLSLRILSPRPEPSAVNPTPLYLSVPS